MGSSIPFAKSAAAKAPGDPRKSIAERYASRDAYLAEARRVADQLVAGRYLLADDVASLLARSGESFDYYMK
jgi:hypothetical protein